MKWLTMGRFAALLGALLLVSLGMAVCEVRQIDAAEISIDNFKGMWSNADLEDLEPEQATDLENWKPDNGRLVKTNGMGEYLGAATPAGYTCRGLFTWIQDSLDQDPEQAGRVYMSYFVNDTSGLVKLYFWKGAGFNSWTSANSVFENDFPTVYHKRDYNTIFQDGGVVRIFPGATDIDSSYGLWMGYIDRTYFDGGYSPSPGFYVYANSMDAPNLDSIELHVDTMTIVEENSVNAGINYYKMAYVYDGYQVGTLTSAFSVSVKNNQRSYINFTINRNRHNLRVTGINLYKNISGDSSSIYDCIEKIDFIKDDYNNSSDVLGGDYALTLRYHAAVEDSIYAGYDSLANNNIIASFRRVYFEDDFTTTLSPYTRHNLYDDDVDVGFNYHYSSSIPETNNVYNYFNFSENENGFNVGGHVDWWSVSGKSPIGSNELPDISNIYTGGMYYGPKVVYVRGLDAAENSLAGSYFIFYETDSPGFYLIVKNKGEFLLLADEIPNQDEGKTATYSLKSMGVGAHRARRWEILRVSSGAVSLQVNNTVKYRINTIPQDSVVNDSLHGKYFVLFSPIGDYAFVHDTSSSGISLSISGANFVRVPVFYGMTKYVLDTTLVHIIDSIPAFNAQLISATVDSMIDDSTFTIDTITAISIQCVDTGVASRRMAIRRSRKTGYDITLTDRGNEKNEYEYTIYDNAYNKLDETIPDFTSISVNGRYSAFMSDRVFSGNVYLDPHGDSEHRPSWISYSELGQPDVLSVSNVIPMPDRSGREVTGIAELYGNPAFGTPSRIHFLNIKNAPDDPAQWNFIHSAHNVGNIAPRAFLQAHGDLYTVPVDGIYRLRPNNLAETDQTPTSNLRISDAIQDKFDALTYDEKTRIIAEYDQYEHELLYWWDRPVGAGSTWTVANAETVTVRDSSVSPKAAYVDSVGGLDAVNFGSSDTLKCTGWDTIYTGDATLSGEIFSVVNIDSGSQNYGPLSSKSRVQFLGSYPTIGWPPEEAPSPPYKCDINCFPVVVSSDAIKDNYTQTLVYTHMDACAGVSETDSLFLIQWDQSANDTALAESLISASRVLVATQGAWGGGTKTIVLDSSLFSNNDTLWFGVKCWQWNTESFTVPNTELEADLNVWHIDSLRHSYSVFNERSSFISFNQTAFDTAYLDSAKIRLQEYSGRGDTVDIFELSATYSEGSVTFATQPGIDSAQLRTDYRDNGSYWDFTINIDTVTRRINDAGIFQQYRFNTDNYDGSMWYSDDAATGSRPRMYVWNRVPVVDPVMSPAGKRFKTSQSVTMTCATSGATIYYTVDGSVPDTTDSVYSTAVTLTDSAVVSARAYKSGSWSNTAVERYVPYAGHYCYAFDIETGEWRELVTGHLPSVLAVDEEAHILAFDSVDAKVYGLGVADTVGAYWRSKMFRLSRDRKMPINNIYLTYRSPACSLHVYPYLDDSDTPSDTLVVDTSSTVQTVKVYVDESAKKVEFGIEPRTATLEDVDIFKIEITY